MIAQHHTNPKPSKSLIYTDTYTGKKVNLSSRIHNDIARSEKKGEKRNNYQGRDDRATSEQGV